MSVIFWNQSTSFDVFLHWLQCNFFSDGFINIFYNDFGNFPEFTLKWVYQTTLRVDIEVFLMVFYCYVGWFSGHTFNSVWYFNFFCNIFCFQINAVVNVVIRLFLRFCDVICQEFFLMCFSHFVNVPCFICENEYFLDDWIDLMSFLSLFWKLFFTCLNCMFESIFWRSSYKERVQRKSYLSARFDTLKESKTKKEVEHVQRKSYSSARFDTFKESKT